MQSLHNWEGLLPNAVDQPRIVPILQSNRNQARTSTADSARNLYNPIESRQGCKTGKDCQAIERIAPESWEISQLSHDWHPIAIPKSETLAMSSQSFAILGIVYHNPLCVPQSPKQAHFGRRNSLAIQTLIFAICMDCNWISDFMQSYNNSNRLRFDCTRWHGIATIDGLQPGQEIPNKGRRGPSQSSHNQDHLFTNLTIAPWLQVGCNPGTIDTDCNQMPSVVITIWTIKLSREEISKILALPTQYFAILGIVVGLQIRGNPFTILYNPIELRRNCKTGKDCQGIKELHWSPGKSTNRTLTSPNCPGIAIGRVPQRDPTKTLAMPARSFAILGIVMGS